MFAPYIKKELNFIDEYFSLLVNNEKRNFPQSIILYGEDIFTQYLLALNLAKIFNCKNTQNFDCECLDCNWIKTNRHPAITTVSKIDFKPEDDKSKTVISVKQIQEIKNLLATTSEHYRFFIICDAEIKTPTSEEKSHLEKFKESGFSLPYEDKENSKYWIPFGLTQKVFQEESANAMLKSIEEPPEKTAFIFLTKNKNDLLETIISRSQCFYVPAKHTEITDTSIISNNIGSYPKIDRLQINNIAKNLLENAAAENISEQELITKFQEYIKQTALANTDSPHVINKMLDDIKILNNTQKQFESYIKPQTALENAIYLIYKNWE